MPIHLRADPADVAPVAVLVGDPGRASRAASEFLEGAVCYNQNRGLLGYTGTFEGTRISVQTTAMGAPSAAIVTEELIRLGVRTVIRAGTCGAVAPSVEVMDLVVATAAVPMEGTTRQYVAGEPFAPVASHRVTSALLAAAQRSRVHTGLIISEDAFYLQENGWERWQRRGVLAVEMEASAIFTVALLRGTEAGCICLAVDRVGHEGSWASDDEIASAATKLLDAALRAAAALSPAEEAKPAENVSAPPAEAPSPAEPERPIVF